MVSIYITVIKIGASDALAIVKKSVKPGAYTHA